ncbi:MAG: HPr(Ser) kinase/phosphatase [Deltaproteobacteria bacterium]|nr:HPr(Ser) kinase/phosphatase [Deltaproteobacteria bacterium]
MLSVKVEQLLQDSMAGLELKLLAGRGGLSRSISVPRIQKPGLALTGYTEQVHPERVQVLGATELGYLQHLSDSVRRAGLENLVGLKPACIVITRSLAAPQDLPRLCEEKEVALLSSSLMSSVFIDRVTQYLEEQLAPSSSIHGVLMDVLGIGILLLGKSGIGKSEAALDLVMRGHRLVADDIVDIRRKPPGALFGSGSEIIKHHMEIRGLGIINIKDLFGISAVRDTKKIELVVELVEWREDEEYDRLGTEDLHYSILEVNIPHIRVPVRPGRNMTSIIEVAARNQLLKLRGHYSARDFQERLNRAIAQARPRDVPRDEAE